jgi:hypothetical protein
MLRKLCVLASVFSIAAATPAMAQLPKFEFEPYLGAYVPVLDLVDQTLTVPGVGSADLTAGQKEAVALGGRLTWWAAGPLGVEGNVFYAFSDVEMSDGTVVSDTSAYVFGADARVAFRFGVPLSPVSFHVNGGVAYLKRGGDGYDDVTDGDTTIGGVVGTGIRVKLPGVLGIRADVDAYLYSAEITLQDPDLGGQVTFDSQFQADLLFSAGLIIGVGL